MRHGHVTGHKRERSVKASTIARDQAKADALAVRVQALARQMLREWQGK